VGVIQGQQGDPHTRVQEGVPVPGAPVLLEADGFRLGDRKRAIAYRDITHIGVSRRGLGIATAHDLIVIRRGRFATRESMEALGTALMDRIARSPDGELQLGRMAEIDHRASLRLPRRATTAFLLIGIAVYLFQLKDPFVQRAASFVPGLVADGEAWRVVTANFIHETLLFPFHIGLNLMCILAFGRMVERVLGTGRTIAVMGASALGAMMGCALAEYPEVVGASGVAAGLAGALLAIELRGGRRLPVWSRVPRRLFFAALALQAAVDVTLPYIAAAAHAGGFLAGHLMAQLSIRGALLDRPLGRVRAVLATAVALGTALAFIALAPLAGRAPEALERHAIRLLHTHSLSFQRDNEVAWLIATERTASELGLQAASALAERAVTESGRTDPDILDTLAEVRFAMGDVMGALDAIDEAIMMTGDDPYFREQRRRFTGERAADDRPEAPTLPWIMREPEPPADPIDALGEDDGIWI
jgi:membrane associated rhomboid family serine protease